MRTVYTIEFGCVDQPIEVFAGVHNDLDGACEDVIARLQETVNEFEQSDTVPHTYIFQETSDDDELYDGKVLVQLLRQDQRYPESDPEEIEWYRIREYVL